MQFIDEKYKEDFSNKLNKLFERDKWQEAKILLEKEIDKFPNEYFLLTSLSTVYYNLKSFEDSLSFAERAIELEPNDALVIYDYGCALSALNRNEDAIAQWHRILHMDIEEIAFGDFGEGLRWAKSIVNDSRYRIANCALEMGDKVKAKEMIAEHLAHRKRGIYSDFTKRQVVEKQDALMAD